MKYSHLEYLPLLSSVEPELINWLCRKAAVSMRIRQGEALFRQGDISEALFVVREGNFKSVWVDVFVNEKVDHPG
ncbi:MAG: hypothetical protein GXX09_07395 [Syntrophomonadaceae bacterium]|nr:hypothetical protein [Syntrophomonadaceae bacterium]